MPLVRHRALPVFDEVASLGKDVLSLEQAIAQDIRELHIGFLNMMPDAALQPTERQFLSLLGSSNQIAQLYVHPFSIPGLSRGDEASTHIEAHYASFSELQEQGLDALILTGANVIGSDLRQEAFWEPLVEVVQWAQSSVTSVLCSCLASHALLQQLYSLRRRPLDRKCWGVFPHRVARSSHPLLGGINTLFDVPHSRWNAIDREQMQSCGVIPLIESAQAGVHLAVSPDGLRFVFMQGHPEYDANSLLKEYKREVGRFWAGELSEYPPSPDGYFGEQAEQLASEYRDKLLDARIQNLEMPPFPESLLEETLDNTWGDTAKAVFNNWLGLVYRLTHLDRKQPFCPGVNPEDPLNLKSGGS